MVQLRLRWLAGLMLGLSFFASARPLSAQDTPKILATTDKLTLWPGRGTYGAVIRNDYELYLALSLPKDRALAWAAKNFNVEKIDFDRHMIVFFISQSQKPGYALTSDLSLKDGKLLIKWEAKSDQPEGKNWFTAKQALLVEKFKGDVVLTPEIKNPLDRALPKPHPEPTPIIATKYDSPVPFGELKLYNRRVYYPYYLQKEPVAKILRSPKEYAELRHTRNYELAMQELAHDLKISYVDFDKQMLLVINEGHDGTRGTRVDIVSVLKKDNGVLVKWNLVMAPVKERDGANYHAGEILLLERIDGPVKFEAIHDEPAIIPSSPGALKKPLAIHKQAVVSLPCDTPTDRAAREKVLRNAADLAQFLKMDQRDLPALFTKQFGVESIDFNRQMVVAQSCGMVPGDKFTSEAAFVTGKDRKTLKEDVLYCRTRLAPTKDCSAAAETHPALLLLTARYDGPIEFAAEIRLPALGKK